MTNLRIGIWLDDLRLGVKQGLKAAAPLKPEIIGLDALGTELSPRALGQSGRRDLAQFVRSRGTSLAALRADVGGRRLTDRQHLDVNLLKLREVFQLAADLSVMHVCVPFGYVPSATAKEDATAYAAIAEGTRAVANMASSLGVRVCWVAGGEPPEALREFLDKQDSSGLIEADLNPGGYVMRGVDPLKALNELSKRVAIATAIDHYRGGAEAPFGQGDVRWGEVIVGLTTLQRSTPVDILAGCTLSGDRMAALSAAVTRLQALKKNPLG